MDNLKRVMKVKKRKVYLLLKPLWRGEVVENKESYDDELR
jgi:hypothetical protein